MKPEDFIREDPMHELDALSAACTDAADQLRELAPDGTKVAVMVLVPLPGGEVSAMNAFGDFSRDELTDLLLTLRAFRLNKEAGMPKNVAFALLAAAQVNVEFVKSLNEAGVL